MFEIRRAMPADAETIARLIREAFSPFESDYTPDGYAYTTPDADAVRLRFDEGPMWIASIDGEDVGTVSGMPDDGRFYVRSMAISPRVQRGGIGQKLLDTLETHARDAGFEKLYLYATFVLPGARRLYEKNGFYSVRISQPEEWCNMASLEMEKRI